MQLGPPVQVLFGSQHFRRQLFNFNLKSAFSYYCPQLAQWLLIGCALQFSGLFWFCSWLLFIRDFKQCKTVKWIWQWNHLEFGVSRRKTQLKLIFLSIRHSLGGWCLEVRSKKYVRNWCNEQILLLHSISSTGCVPVSIMPQIVCRSWRPLLGFFFKWDWVSLFSLSQRQANFTRPIFFYPYANFEYKNPFVQF